MGDTTSIQQFPAEQLISLCEEESRRFRDNGARVESYCMEAFRRAVVEGDEFCWRRLQDLYRSQIISWCRAAGEIRIPADDQVAFVWEKFWQNYRPAKLAQATTLSQVLSYLKLCSVSAVFDAKRELSSLRSLDSVVDLADGQGAALGELVADRSPGPEEVTVSKLDRASLVALINAELNDDKERLFFIDKFELGLTSREIYRLHGEVFDGVDDVYRVTRNVLERLRRRLKDWNE